MIWNFWARSPLNKAESRTFTCVQVHSESSRIQFTGSKAPVHTFTKRAISIRQLLISFGLGLRHSMQVRWQTFACVHHGTWILREKMRLHTEQGECTLKICGPMSILSVEPFSCLDMSGRLKYCVKKCCKGSTYTGTAPLRLNSRITRQASASISNSLLLMCFFSGNKNQANGKSRTLKDAQNLSCKYQDVEPMKW